MPRSPKVLLVVPANNTTMEREIDALLPELGQILLARVKRPLRALTVEDLPDYGAATLESVAPFIAERPDLVVYGCTAAGFLAGPDGNAHIVNELEYETRAPVISTAVAMVEALRHSRAQRVAIVTPYLAHVNQGLTRYLASCGIEVERLASFMCETTDALGSITEAQVMAKALAIVTPRCQALFIACSQLPTLNIIAPLREGLRIPVWSSIQATGWAIARMLAVGGVPMSLLADASLDLPQIPSLER